MESRTNNYALLRKMLEERQLEVTMSGATPGVVVIPANVVTNVVSFQPRQPRNRAERRKASRKGR